MGMIVLWISLCKSFFFFFQVFCADFSSSKCYNLGVGVWFHRNLNIVRICKTLIEIYQSCLSAFLLLQAKVAGPSFCANVSDQQDQIDSINPLNMLFGSIAQYPGTLCNCPKSWSEIWNLNSDNNNNDTTNLYKLKKGPPTGGALNIP